MSNDLNAPESFQGAILTDGHGEPYLRLRLDAAHALIKGLCALEPSEIANKVWQLYVDLHFTLRDYKAKQASTPCICSHLWHEHSDKHNPQGDARYCNEIGCNCDDFQAIAEPAKTP